MVVPSTRVHVAFPQPQTHLLHVEVVTPGLTEGTHDFFMPVWTPGSYLVREYSRHVESVEARDGRGAELVCDKVSKNRWRVELREDGDVHLRYRVYARDLTVRTNFIDEKRAYWNGAATYVVAKERHDAPLEMTVTAPKGWSVHTGLPFEDGAFRARTLDHAVDCPVVASAAPVTSFDVDGIRHDCVLEGVAPSERAALTDDIERIVRAAMSIFGGQLPYETYTFLVFADSTGSGGLEHENSCVIHVPRASLRKPAARKRVLSLFAHEHFHAWNVKRIRPVGLRTFDYEAENYTPDLWLAEGFTSYYQEIVSQAAGVWTRAEFLDRLAKLWEQVVATPGRAIQSVSQSSFDAWIKLYRPDENTRNTTVSYYTKGAIVAWCLDLLILARSDGRNSLDTVMQALFADFVTSGPGQSRELIERAVADAAGCALDAEIAVLVDGVEDPPIQEWLADFGLELKSPSGSERATLAIKTRTEDGRLLVDSVPRGSAGWAIGLSPGDEVVAIDGERVLPAEWQPMLEEQLQPGQEITLQLFRRGLLTTVSGRLGAAPEGSWKLIEGSGRLPFRTTKRP